MGCLQSQGRTGGIGRRGLVTVKGVALDPHAGTRTAPTPSACDPGCDVLRLWTSVSPLVKCRGGSQGFRGPGGLDLPPAMLLHVEAQPYVGRGDVGTWGHGAPACTCFPASPPQAVLFKVTVVWLVRFLKNHSHTGAEFHKASCHH